MTAFRAFPFTLVAALIVAQAGQIEGQAAASAPVPTQEPRLQIVVDQRCLVQAESDPAVLGDHNDAFRDRAICHRESVLSSYHVEEKISEGERSRFRVRIAEQEYVMQNVTDRPAVFVVRQNVPENWTVDSDPQPSSQDGSMAIFQVNAEPGQIVRLHVGLRHSIPVETR